MAGVYLPHKWLTLKIDTWNTIIRLCGGDDGFAGFASTRDPIGMTKSYEKSSNHGASKITPDLLLGTEMV